MQLAPRTLRPLASFKVPRSQVVTDGDFGASPTLFGRFVGACDKNGIFYALTRYKLRLAWWKQIGAPAGRQLGFGRCVSATPNAIYLINAATGRILRTLLTGGHDFAQSVFADGRLFTANDNGLYAWGLRRRRH